jgi:hypothetical protein
MTVFYVVSMSEGGRVSYFENYIDTLKRRMKPKVLEEKLKEKQRI